MQTRLTCTRQRRCTALQPAVVCRRCLLLPYRSSFSVAEFIYAHLQVSLLIAAGARLDALDKFGATAYAWAVKYGHQHLLSVLRPDAA